jgi:hypothetical protein
MNGSHTNRMSYSVTHPEFGQYKVAYTVRGHDHDMFCRGICALQKHTWGQSKLHSVMS